MLPIEKHLHYNLQTVCDVHKQTETVCYIDLFCQLWDLYFLSADSLIKVIFSAGSVSTNGTSVNSNAGRFTDLIKFRETILQNRCEVGTVNPTSTFYRCERLDFRDLVENFIRNGSVFLFV